MHKLDSRLYIWKHTNIHINHQNKITHTHTKYLKFTDSLLLRYYFSSWILRFCFSPRFVFLHWSDKIIMFICIFFAVLSNSENRRDTNKKEKRMRCRKNTQKIYQKQAILFYMWKILANYCYLCTIHWVGIYTHSNRWVSLVSVSE